LSRLKHKLELTNLLFSGDGSSAGTIIIGIAVGIGILILALSGFSIWKRKRLLSVCNGNTPQKGDMKLISRISKEKFCIST
jgi:uncharacterized iron-regulated membrane protein